METTERHYRVYRDLPAGSTCAARAVKTGALLGRDGMLTLSEARQVQVANPDTWIGRLPPIDRPHDSVVRVLAWRCSGCSSPVELPGLCEGCIYDGERDGAGPADNGRGDAGADQVNEDDDGY